MLWPTLAVALLEWLVSSVCVSVAAQGKRFPERKGRAAAATAILIGYSDGLIYGLSHVNLLLLWSF